MSSNRYYTRFVPREELGEVRPWEFGSVNGPAIGLLGPLLPEAVADPLPEPLPEALPGIELDEHEALLQQAREQAYAQGLAQGQAQGQESERLQWQQRMDDYVAGQGREVAEQPGHGPVAQRERVSMASRRPRARHPPGPHRRVGTPTTRRLPL